MAEEENEKKDSEEKDQPSNKVEEATGFELKELAKAPLAPPESKIDKPPKGGLGLAIALALGLFIFALIIGAAASWLAAGLLLIFGSVVIAVISKLTEKLK